MNWRGLALGELRLTCDILFGLLIGFAVLKSNLAGKLMDRFVPYLKKIGICSVLAMALTLSLGSAKAGAALIASALENGEISRRSAKWGTLLLSFPAYLHRWPSTMIMASSLAGFPGAVFGLILLLRSVLRFVIIIFILRRGGEEETEIADVSAEGKTREIKFGLRMLKTLPLAWFFFAVAYLLVPQADNIIKSWLLGGTVLPLAALTVAAASIAHVSAALALAGGSLAAGELTAAQAVFALLLGNGFGIVTRLFRTNAGYYFGLFSRDLAREMIFWNFATTAGVAALSLILAVLPLLA